MSRRRPPTCCRPRRPRRHRALAQPAQRARQPASLRPGVRRAPAPSSAADGRWRATGRRAGHGRGAHGGAAADRALQPRQRHVAAQFATPARGLAQQRRARERRVVRDRHLDRLARPARQDAVLAAERGVGASVGARWPEHRRALGRRPLE
eukprot:2837724-Prymnesium_polylepis.1